eukprot:1145836-Pelagomonas_calceolata.AAC.28
MSWWLQHTGLRAGAEVCTSACITPSHAVSGSLSATGQENQQTCLRLLACGDTHRDKKAVPLPMGRAQHSTMALAAYSPAA